jgi:hypothetical protein
LTADFLCNNGGLVDNQLLLQCYPGSLLPFVSGIKVEHPQMFL